MTDERETELLATIAGLRRQLTFQSEYNHERNLALDALHHVWCDGGCRSGVHRWGALKHTPLTPEIVEAVERGVKRMRTWLVNAEHKRRNEAERAKLEGRT